MKSGSGNNRKARCPYRAGQRTLVLAVFVTPSRSVARMTEAIRVSVDGSGPHLEVGKDDNKSDQIKFRLSDWVFEYGDFRDEESADKYEGFLVVASSKGDTLRAEGLTQTPRINSEILNSKLFARMSIVFRHGSFVPCSNP
jgi:hypothetical protein